MNASVDTNSTSRDDLTEAVTAETEYAEAARLQEAKSILLDYISLLKGKTNKTGAALLAK